MRSLLRATGSCSLCAFALLVGRSHAGGTPENAVILVDPSRQDALAIANYYKTARDIPDSNFLFIDPTAANYSDFVDRNLDALFGHLTQGQLDDHIDYVVITPASSFFVSAPGLLVDQCSPANRFSLSGAYTAAFIASEVLNGDDVTRENGYSPNISATARGFDSNNLYWNGTVSTNTSARRYYIGAMLGYTGERGNTVSELRSMIDRSVSADGTRPAGTFYYMETTDVARSGPRDGLFDDSIDFLAETGGVGEHLFDILPLGRHDALGIMTGWATPDIDGADYTLVPGAFCDHLTSFAATFDTSAQTKMSRWIVRGASGTWGAVEEPCNYAGKFPAPRMHVFYQRGLALGEAALRSADYVPFQSLLYGDPLTRTFAHLPVVSVPDAPVAPVSGTISLTPSATTTDPAASIASFELLIDGVLAGTIAPGAQFSIDTATLADGWHDLRVLAYDNTTQRSVGRWIGALDVNNDGLSSSVGAAPLTGDLNTAFSLTLSAGGAPDELRVLHNGRVVAASTANPANLVVHGRMLGAGNPELVAEALYPGGTRVRSAPLAITVSDTVGVSNSQAPVAFAYTKRVSPDSPFVVELPATIDNANTALTYVLVTNPTLATVPTGQAGAYRLMRPLVGATGVDTFTFRVDSAAGSSATVTVTLVFGDLCPGDIDGDNDVDLSDLGVVLSNFGLTSGGTLETGDLDNDGDVDLSDLGVVLANFALDC